MTEQEIIEAAETAYPEYPDDGETAHHDAMFEEKQDAFIAGARFALSEPTKSFIERKAPRIFIGNNDGLHFLDGEFWPRKGSDVEDGNDQSNIITITWEQTAPKIDPLI